MATTKKPKSKKKTTKKKTRAKKPRAPKELTPAQRLQLQVEQAAAALIRNIQNGEVLGLAVIAFGKDENSDVLTITGFAPRHRLSYMLALASHMNMTEAARNIQLANERRVAEIQAAAGQ